MSALTRREVVLGGLFVLSAVIFQVSWMGGAAVLLSVGLVLCFGLWLTTPWRLSTALTRGLVAANAVFALHATEEFLAGFQREFPVLFGRSPWTDLQFLVFNGVWAAVFLSAAVGARAGSRWPVLIALFFAVVGGIGNGVAHLVIAAQRGEYFPGTWTAPICFVLGLWILRAMYRADEPVGPGRGSSYS